MDIDTHLVGETLYDNDLNKIDNSCDLNKKNVNIQERVKYDTQEQLVACYKVKYEWINTFSTWKNFSESLFTYRKDSTDR